MKEIDWLAVGRKDYAEYMAQRKHKALLKAKPSKRMKPETRQLIIVTQKRAKEAQKYRTNVQYKLGRLFRRRMLSALMSQNITKTFQSHVRLLGCTVEEAQKHIEAKFEPWMSWENHGPQSWHIDHVKPLSAFDLTDPVQAAEACHYTNLQPLHWRDNIVKGGVRKYPARKRDSVPVCHKKGKKAT